MNIRLLLLGMPVAVVLGATPAVVELSEGDPNAPTPVLVANQFIPRGTSGNYIQTRFHAERLKPERSDTPI
jgi:hypothetical protein